MGLQQVECVGNIGGSSTNPSQERQGLCADVLLPKSIVPGIIDYLDLRVQFSNPPLSDWSLAPLLFVLLSLDP